MSSLAQIAERETIKQGAFHSFMDKSAQSMSMLSKCEINVIVDFFPACALVLCKSSPSMSSLVQIPETDTVKEVLTVSKAATVS